MRPVIALILTLAAAVSAAPGNTDAESGSLLSRQNCIYQCSCSSSTQVPNPASVTCCASVGGSWNGNLCTGLSVTQEGSYKSCCGRPGALCFGPPGCPPP